MTPPKPQDFEMPCESSYCLVPALKESIEKAERFNQDYRKDVKLTLEGIKENTGQIAVYLANQEALKERVIKVENEVDSVFKILRVEIIPIIGKKVSRGEMISYVVAGVAICTLLIALVK